MTEHLADKLIIQAEEEPTALAHEARLLKTYELVSAHYRQDMQMFWTRGNMFLLIELGFFALIANIVEKRADIARTGCMLALLISLIWFMVARSSAVWIDAWRRRMIEIDAHVNPLRSYTVDIRHPGRGLRLTTAITRPSILGQVLPLLFSGAWLVIVFQV